MHLLCLSDAMRSVLRLSTAHDKECNASQNTISKTVIDTKAIYSLHTAVPITVIEYNSISPSQVDSQSTTSSTEDEAE